MGGLMQDDIDRVAAKMAESHAYRWSEMPDNHSDVPPYSAVLGAKSFWRKLARVAVEEMRCDHR
jgi:hypothetical protein